MTRDAFEGLVSGALQAVFDLIEANRADIGPGLNQVGIGERLSGWDHPAVFVRLAPEGVQEAVRSGRILLDTYDIPVRLVAKMRDPVSTLDAEVSRVLEDCLDLLDAATRTTPGGFPPGCTAYRVTVPVRLGELVPQEEGAYTTIGSATVVFRVTVDRG